MAVITIAGCSTPLNTYTYQDIEVGGDDYGGGQYEQKCVLSTSSYNAIYSKGEVQQSTL
jgi:hypothetical protein